VPKFISQVRQAACFPAGRCSLTDAIEPAIILELVATLAFAFGLIVVIVVVVGSVIVTLVVSHEFRNIVTLVVSHEFRNIDRGPGGGIRSMV